MERFGALDLRVETKPDLTPVTDADPRRRTRCVTRCRSERPEDAVFGEEFGGTTNSRGRQWVIDPIDGTKNFVRGVPVWATLIALLEDGVPVAGVVSAPALERRWWAGAGQGAFASFGGATRRVRCPRSPTWSRRACRSPTCSGWAGGPAYRFIELTDAVWRVRGYGDFRSYCLVAEGAVDIAAEPEVSLWDLAPLDILVREAGGASPIWRPAGPHGGSAVATNGLLHEAVLNRINGG